MSVALPWVMVAAVLGAMVVGLLHYLARRTSTPWLLPTARFLPAGDVPVTSVQRALDDRRLLLLRLLALASLALGAAGTRCTGIGASTRHILVVDRALMRDSTRWMALLSEEGRKVPRSAIQAVPAPLAEWPSLAFVEALQVAAQVARAEPAVRHLALHVLLPDSVRLDDGWAAWRAQWPAQVDVQVVGRPVDERALSGAAAPVSAPEIRWPPRAGTTGTLRGFAPRRVADTVGALVAGGSPIVAPWLRRWEAVASVGVSGAATGRPMAWWSDGEPAVLEFATANGCERSVAVETPPGSDLLISPAAVGWQRVLAAPCGGAASARRMASRDLMSDSTLRRASWPRHLSADWLRDGREAQRWPSPRWLAPAFLTIALLLLGAEAWWRSRGRS